MTSLFAAVQVRGLSQRSIVRTRDVRADPQVADTLGLAGCTPLVHLERLRLAGEEPLALDRIWMPATLARPLLEVDFTRTALYDELLAHCGIALTGGSEQVRAVSATRAERALLRVPAQVALLSIERTGCLHGRPIEYRHTLVRGDRFAVTASYDRHGYALTPNALTPNTLAPGEQS